METDFTKLYANKKKQCGAKWLELWHESFCSSNQQNGNSLWFIPIAATTHETNLKAEKENSRFYVKHLTLNILYLFHVWPLDTLVLTWPFFLAAVDPIRRNKRPENWKTFPPYTKLCFKVATIKNHSVTKSVYLHMKQFLYFSLFLV